MSKYEPLRKFLESSTASEIPMTFAEIERVIGSPLPDSRNIRAWWSNNPNNNVMTKAWLAAGYKTEQVDIDGRKLVFRRTRSAPDAASKDEHGKAQRKRHPLIGFLKGMITIAPGVDLTEPADPDWGRAAWGDEPAAKERA